MVIVVWYKSGSLSVVMFYEEIRQAQEGTIVDLDASDAET
jgi:hypothetical protein